MAVFKPGSQIKISESTEKFLSGLCMHSFLSLWCYSNPFTDRHFAARRMGKELCDQLIVFGDDVIIFSDKSCVYPDSGNEQLDWSRWYRKAIAGSVDQERAEAREDLERHATTAITDAGNSADLEIAIKKFYAAAYLYCEVPSDATDVEYEAEKKALDEMLQSAGR